jgi:sugar lactone lactonase YvrE
MPSSLRTLFIFVITLATAACSPTATNDLIAQPHSAIDGKRHKVKATIRIVIPKRRHHRRVLLHGHYISVSTRSIAIAVTPSAGGTAKNFNADLTPASNPDCLPSSSGTVCTLPLELAAGNYTVTVATYDGLLAGGNAPNNPPTGNKLSAHQSVPLAVNLDKANALQVTLDGIPTGVALVPAAGSVLTGNDTSGFALARCSQPAQNVDVYGVDAGNNYILGPGAPTPSLTSNDTNNLPVTATPEPATPSQFTLTPPAYPTKSVVVQLTAGVTPEAGIGASSQSAQINVTIGATSCYSIAEYSAPASSISGPNGIAASGSNLWFTIDNSVAEITTAGVAVGTYSVGSSPNSLAFDGTNMWVVNGGGAPGSVTELSPSGATMGTYSVGNYPDGIAYDGTNTWVPNSGGTTVTKLSPAGATLGTYPVGSGPGAIAFDGTNMWVANYSAGASASVTELSPSGATVGTYAAGSNPAAIAFDGTNMWVTNLFNNSITELSPTGTTLHTYQIPTSDSRPEFITLGADGAMWFTEINGNNVGRITSDGTITEIPVPTPSGEPLGITKGPDGNIWFTEKSGDKVGTVLPH